MAGSAGLEPWMRTELLILLTHDGDSAVSGKAEHALLTVAPETLLEAASKTDAPMPVFAYAAEHATDREGAAEVLVGNPNCPGMVLVKVARHLTPKHVAAIMANLEQLASAELVAALAERDDLTPEQKQTLGELTSKTDEQTLEASMADAEPDAAKRKTLLQRLATMTVVERLTLALKGGREERGALIRDPNKMVSRAVLQSPRLTEQEVENFSAMANLSDEILRAISLNRNFMKNYAVVRNLVNNPKTPMDVSLALLKRLITTDLKKLTMNKNVPETVRGMATKMVRQKAILGEA